MIIKISKTHSKKDLFDIIDTFKIPIYLNNPTKNILVKELEEAVAGELYNIIPDNKYLIKDKNEFISYLQNTNPRKILSVKDKKQVIQDCKRIKQYCLNNFCVVGTDFNNDKEVEELIISISKYGNIPSVRKSMKLYNSNPCIKNTIKPKLSKMVERELEIKKSLKQTTLNILIIKQGPFTIDFN